MQRAPQRILLVGCMTALIAACAAYQPEPISPTENAIALESRTLDDPRLQRFLVAMLPSQGETSPKPPWDFTTLTLAALYYHPDLDIAHARLATAQAGVITAHQRPNPILNFSAVFGSNAVAGAITPGALPVLIGPVINFVIETFGKREYRTAQAEHLAESARWDLATAGWQVRGRVRAALLNLWAAQQRMTLTGRRVDLQEQLVGLLERRLTMGEASSVDVTRERINRAQIALALRDLERAAADARVQLAVAIGIPARTLDGVDLVLGAFDHSQLLTEDIVTGELRRRTLNGRTDVQATLAEYEAAQSALQLEVANQYPNVTLGPGYIYEFGTNRFILSPTVDLPIFNQNQGQIAQAIANRQQAAAKFAALQVQIIGAIDQAAAAYRGATQSLATADPLLADAQRRQRQVADSFRAGQVDRPTLVTTELELAAILLLRLDPIVLQRQALGALEDALQQPLFDPGRWPYVPEEKPPLANTKPSYDQ
jgi:cobalt-zinc-cadmium efflux system outer membrane protein